MASRGMAAVLLLFAPAAAVDNGIGALSGLNRSSALAAAPLAATVTPTAPLTRRRAACPQG